MRKVEFESKLRFQGTHFIVYRFYLLRLSLVIFTYFTKYKIKDLDEYTFEYNEHIINRLKPYMT